MRGYNKFLLFQFLIVCIGCLSNNGFAQTTTEIAKRGISSTVSIVSLDKNMQPLGFGSGFIIDNQTIVTNVHVVEGANKVYILKNSSASKYDVIGYSALDRINDLAILKVDNFYGDNLELGTTEMPEIGLRVYATGNPKGLSGTFSEGIVSGIRDFANRQVIQITAPISPGSSGGPILNGSAQVIGVAFGSFSDGQNLNFAIPVKYVKSLLEKQTTIQQISTIKTQPKTQATVNSNVKEGVQIRNIEPLFEIIQGNPPYFYGLNFSIKNNLPHNISDIRILLLVYDNVGVMVDSFEGIFFRQIGGFTGIKPFLARTFDGSEGMTTGTIYDDTGYGTKHEHKYENSQYINDMGMKPGYKIKARILDFKINE